jgi:hypothetical protein
LVGSSVTGYRFRAGSELRIRVGPGGAPAFPPLGLHPEHRYSFWWRMNSQRLIQAIGVAAQQSGYPNVVLAMISLSISAITVWTVSILVGLLSLL